LLELGSLLLLLLNSLDEIAIRREWCRVTASYKAIFVFEFTGHVQKVAVSSANAFIHASSVCSILGNEVAEGMLLLGCWRTEDWAMT